MSNIFIEFLDVIDAVQTCFCFVQSKFLVIKMDVKEVSERFWLVVERDLLEVPVHIKNAFT